MKAEAFLESLKDEVPPSSFSGELKAVWYAKKGDWDKAHSIAQDIHNLNGAWIHAYLHRYEGDSWNAEYWYRQAKRTMPSHSLEQELEELIQYFIKI